MAVAEASFNISIDSISSGLISPKGLLGEELVDILPDDMGMPSITINGEELLVIEL
jgi:hypothetical protein